MSDDRPSVERGKVQDGEFWEREPDIDLGDDHKLFFTGWHPDRELNPQYDGIEDVEKFGALIDHLKPDGTKCSGGLTFDSPTAKALSEFSDRPYVAWTVESWDPLTISPSVLCSCGDHGWIREGKWVRA